MSLRRPLRPRAWHVVIFAAALITVFLAADRMYRSRAEEMSLISVDAAMLALRAKLEGLGPLRDTPEGLYAGPTKLAGDIVVRDIERETQQGATIFRANRRVATTARAVRSDAPALGTHASAAITEHVLEQGHVFRGVTRTIGRKWVIRYEPLQDADGSRVGMLATFVDHDRFLFGLVPFRFLVGGTLLVLFAIVSALWIAMGRYGTRLEAKQRAIEDRNQQLTHAAESQRQRERDLEVARAEAEAARIQAEQASKAKSLFLANMSHELRMPLNAIIGYAEMLLDECDNLQDEQDLSKIVGASRHLLAIISDILDVSKVEAGRLELEIQEFDLREVVRSVAEAAAPLVANNQNSMRVRVDRHIGPIESDPTRVRQILFNLLSNAAKFTERGEIELTVEATLNLHGPGVRFTVRDSGIGMSEAQLSRVFQAFTQADASHTRRYGGTGLGLTIVRLITERLDGQVHVTSTEGLGSAFVVELPQRPSARRRLLERPTIVQM